MLAPVPVRSSGLYQDLDYAPRFVRSDYSAGLHQDLVYAPRSDLVAAVAADADSGAAPAPALAPLCAPCLRAAAPA